ELDTILVTTLLENTIIVVVDDGTTPDVDTIICVELDMATVSIVLLEEIGVDDCTYDGGVGALLEVSAELLGETGTEDGAVIDDAGLLLSDKEAGEEDDKLGLTGEATTTGDAGDEITEVE